MNIRHFEDREDVAGILRVNGLAWREAYAGILPEDVLQSQSIDPSENEIEEWFERFQANQNGVLVAIDSEEMVRGYADFRWGDVETKAFVGEGEAGLKAIYVEPEYWNQGIGTRLLERGLELLPRDVEVVRLEMFSENDIGRRFYEARGFEQTDTGEFDIAGTSYPTDIYSLYR